MAPLRALALLLLPLAAAAQTPGDPTILPVLGVSRSSGVAPLAVFFDASASTSPGTTERPFHDLEYRWNFGDAAGVAWQNGNRPGGASKNVAAGPLAGHVFERPGTYTVTLTVMNGTTAVARRTRIVVADPEVVFAGANTVCISAGTRDFSACPSGAQQAVVANFADAIRDYKAPGRRLLFRRGETFRAERAAVLNVDGPGIVGSFGPASDPPPVLQSTADTDTLQLSSFTTPNIRDWRIMDLELAGNGTINSNGVNFRGGFDQATLLRLKTRRQRLGVIADAYLLDYLDDQEPSPSTKGHRIWDQLAVVDSAMVEVNHGSGSAVGYGVYISADRLFFAGNFIDNGGTAANDVSHNARFPYLGRSVVSHNTLMNPGSTQHHVKLHAPRWNTAGVSQRGSGQGYSRWVIIADNKFAGGYNPWMVTVGPQNSGNDERVMDVILERNWYASGPGSQDAELLWASEVTSRNNIYDLARGSTVIQSGVNVSRRGVEPPPTRIRVYNNSFYTARALSSARFAGIYLSPDATDIVARANVAYAPKATAPLMIDNRCGFCLDGENNSSDAQVKSSLPFTAAAPVRPNQFRAAGYAAGSGVATPALYDFFLAPRPSPRDMGAANRP